MSAQVGTRLLLDFVMMLGGAVGVGLPMGLGDYLGLLLTLSAAHAAPTTQMISSSTQCTLEARCLSASFAAP
jgi:hypothetical protein